MQQKGTKTMMLMSVAFPKQRDKISQHPRRANRMRGSYLLLLPESKETNAGHLHDLEPHTGDITLRLTATTETGDEDLVVLINKVEATVVLCVHEIR